MTRRAFSSFEPAPAKGLFASGLLQRKCACGKNTGGTTRAGCEEKNRHAQRHSAAKNSHAAHEVGHASGHATHDDANTVMKPTGAYNKSNSTNVSKGVCRRARRGSVLTAGGADKGCCMDLTKRRRGK